MMLLLHHPEVAALSCEDCLRWVFDFKEKRFTLHRGERLPRPAKGNPPCWQCPKCSGEADKSPETGRTAELSSRNRAMLRSYYEGEQGDRLTQRAHGVIRRTIDDHGRYAQRIIVELLAGKPW